MATTSLTRIQAFLNPRRIAVVGVSRDEKDYSRIVVAELKRCGYQVLPVNPALPVIKDMTCFRTIAEITPAAESAILLVPEKSVLETTRQCLQAGIRHLWFRRSGSSSEAYRQAIDEADATKANVISGECPIMFLPNTAWIHRAHSFLRQVTGSYPH